MDWKWRQRSGDDELRERGRFGGSLEEEDKRRSWEV